MTRKKILVIGGGAVGGIIAAILREKGYDVSLVVKDKNLAREITKNGLHISGHCGTFQTPVKAYPSVTKIKRRPDYIFIATKAPDMPAVARDILPLIPDETLFVSMQNGIVEEELASIVGKKRTVGCVVGWGATMHSRTSMEMTSGGDFTIGFIDDSPKQNLEELEQILGDILPVKVSDNILLDLYSKLIINSCITTVGAICGLTLGNMLKKKFYRSLFLDVIREAIEVSNALNWNVPPYAGKLDYYKLLNWSGFRKHAFLMLFGFKYRKLKSSSLQSLERGRKTEVRYFNGYISRKGKEFNVPTPVNDRMVELVEEIESGKRKIDGENYYNFAP